jgi:hypothetical protein
MTPLEFLREEFDNVERALHETLRHEYGPERSSEYYTECTARLGEIKKAIQLVGPNDLQIISDHLNELSALATWISLIERSHLGEFSWPFADELRRMATELLPEQTLKGDWLDPIIHIVAEGQGYRIIYEQQVPAASGRRRFVVVAFPRSLKHHVLLHSIFGHELCHTALYTTDTGSTLQTNVMAVLKNSSALLDTASASNWLGDRNAPAEVRSILQAYATIVGQAFILTDHYLEKWLIELTCDLFGLILFGPSFLAAHRVILQPMHPSPYTFDFSFPTHPPYAIRHRMLVQAMRILGWDQPVLTAGNTLRNSEVELIQYLLDDAYPAWATVFDDTQLRAAIAGTQALFQAHTLIGYVPTNDNTLSKLINCIVKGLPPILAEIDVNGVPSLNKIDITVPLYAGWICWIGRNRLPNAGNLSFLLINQLCNHALLQQRAINEAVDAGVT